MTNRDRDTVNEIVAVLGASFLDGDCVVEEVRRIIDRNSDLEKQRLVLLGSNKKLSAVINEHLTINLRLNTALKKLSSAARVWSHGVRKEGVPRATEIALAKGVHEAVDAVEMV